MAAASDNDCIKSGPGAATVAMAWAAAMASAVKGFPDAAAAVVVVVVVVGRAAMVRGTAGGATTTGGTGAATDGTA